jgi:hypothetical protein
LTDDGRKLVPLLSAPADKNDAEFFGHLSRTDRQAIRTIMKSIVKRKGFQAVPVDRRSADERLVAR